MSLISDINSEKIEMDMTPMIDVTFLLLIFFMCTLKFKVLEGKLTAYLPKDVGVNSSDAPPVEKVQIDIHVIVEGNKVKPKAKPSDPAVPYDDPTGESRYVYEGRKLSYTIGTQKFTDLAEVQKRLRKIRTQRGDDDAPAVLQPYAGTIMGDVIPVLDAAVAADFTDITFGGAFADHVK
ncbi:MAG: biopolymer transporter ExbD [Planctomycetes bacterium]|nr:biopolymer transporter ExbD [Planctomycetota bacterium]